MRTLNSLTYDNGTMKSTSRKDNKVINLMQDVNSYKRGYDSGTIAQQDILVEKTIKALS